MKIKLRNNNNLGSGQGEFTIQDKSKVESLYITGCPNLNVWSIFDSIRQTPGNQLEGKPIRLGSINRQDGTWGELQEINDTYKGFDINGDEIQNPALIGTWHLKGMHEGEYNIASMESYFNNELSIVVDKNLITFTDNTVNSLINSRYGFEYDTDSRKGVDYNTLALVSDIGQNFADTSIETFDEFQYFIGITTLPASAFQNCSNLTSIELPSSIKTIGNNAFKNCSSLDYIIFPDSLQSIGNNITEGCSNLEYIRITSVVTISPDSFPGVPGNEFKIYVGNGSSPYHDNKILNNLLNNNVWKNYRDRLDTWYNKIYNDKIPTEYKKLEYIESDATNIIDTECTFTDNTRFIADIAFINVNEEAVYGNKQSGLYGTPNNQLKFTVSLNNDDYPISLGYNWIDSTETLYDIDIKGGTVNRNEILLYSNQAVKSKGGDITLFGDNSKQYRGRAWMTKIYEDDVLIHDLVPVYKISTGAAGFYDCAEGISEDKRFKGFTTYSGYEYDTRLITETDNSRIITNNNEYIVVSNYNTDKIKTSLMNLGSTTTGYYTIVSDGTSDKKYSLESLSDNVNNLSYLCGLQNFSETQNYLQGDFVAYEGYCYEFTKNHYGEWKDYDVIKTSVFEKLEDLIEADNKTSINVQLRTRDPIYLDYITSQGDEYVNTGLVINDNSENYKIVTRFSYSTFISDGCIFGDYKDNCYETGIKLGNSDDGSCVCSIGGHIFNIPSQKLDKNIIHEVTLSSNSVEITSYSSDNIVIKNYSTNNYTTPSNLSANTNSLGIFANFGNGTPEISQLGISLYYFNIYKNDVLIYEYVPAIKNGVVGLDINLPDIQKSGSGEFLPPQEFSGPISNKVVTLKYFNSTENIVGITDKLGYCTFNNFKKDCIYDIITSNLPTGWVSNEIIRKNYRDGENNYIYLKEEEEYCNININITLNNNSNIPDDFNNLIVYAITDESSRYYSNSKLIEKTGTISITGNLATTSINFPKNQQVILVFPTVSGYTKPANITLSASDTNTNEIISNVVYTIN